jgi:dihydropteroate synthase
MNWPPEKSRETRYLVSMLPDAGRRALPSAAETPWALRRHDGSLLHPGRGPAIMAVLNVTPDSFSDGGLYVDPGRAQARMLELIEAGADLIDVGAESTRPGADSLTAAQEWARLAPLFRRLEQAQLPVALSIDTRHAQVAHRAAERGFALLNLPFPQELLPQGGDSQGRSTGGGKLAQLLASFDAVVVMHARGTPATMRQLTDYGDKLCQTVVDELRQTAARLTEEHPVLRRRLMFDPGLGFAKTAEQSLELLARTAWLRAALAAPIVVGASRKSMLGAVTGQPVQDRMLPSVIAATWAALHGADMVRVHDVAETKVALQLVTALRGAEARQVQPPRSAAEARA